jgi:hypothetical protein
LYIALAQVFHHLRGFIALFRCHQEVNMVGHQDIGVKIDLMLLTSLTEMIKVELVIVFSEEASSPVVAPLDEMQGNSRDLEPWASGHSGSNGDFRMLEA